MANQYPVKQPSDFDFPANVNDGVVKMNAAGTAWEEVAPGTAPNMSAEGVLEANAAGTHNSLARTDHVHAQSASIVTTTDATLTTIKTITPTASAVIFVDATIVGIRTDSPDEAIAYHQRSVYKNSAASAVTEVANKLENMHEEEAALAACSITTAASGGTILIRVTGIGGATIKWKAYIRTVTETIA